MTTQMRRIRWWPVPVALGLALIIGWMNLRTDDSGIVALPLVGAAVALGFARPRSAPVWGLLLGAGIPLGEALALVFGWRVPYPVDLGAAIWVPLVPLAAALLGAGVRWLVSRLDGGPA